MERLTREMTFEEEYIILQKEVKELFDKEDRESEPPESHCVVRRALRCIKKLVSEVEQYKAYNDLEEQGLLLRLPCKVGDTVYHVVQGRIFEVSNVDLFFLLLSVAENRFNNSVFLTKSEAEQKLKEMECD